MDGEQPLTGGNAGGDVMRVGGTVRKPWRSSTPAVVAFMDAVRAAGVDVPAVHGRDEQGRQVQEFIPGHLAMEVGRLTVPELRRVGAMVRSIHDASEAFRPPPDAAWDCAIAAPGQDLVCHNDLAPWNLIIGDRWVFIDWDAAAPSTRLWDLAYAAQTFTLNDSDQPVEDAGRNLRAFVDGYDADDRLRELLPVAMRQRTQAMYELLSFSRETDLEPWASMFTAGHGAHWADVTAYVGRHEEVWRSILGSGRAAADVADGTAT